jgi:hypothetical protein
MFWRKKKIAAATVEASAVGTGTATAGAVSVSGATATPASPKAEKLPGPKFLPDMLSDHLVRQMAKEANWVRGLSMVMRPRSGGSKGFDVRIFAQYEAASSSTKIKDYTTLDQYPQLILFEGWFDKESKKVELEEKRVTPKVTICTEKEIQQKIEALTEKENKTHFFLASSPASGGPLGRGAALVELKPNYPAKGQKKYILTAVSVNEMESAGKGMRMLDTNDPKHVARWIKERHFKYTTTR